MDLNTSAGLSNSNKRREKGRIRPPCDRSSDARYRLAPEGWCRVFPQGKERQPRQRAAVRAGMNLETSPESHSQVPWKPADRITPAPGVMRTASPAPRAKEHHKKTRRNLFCRFKLSLKLVTVREQRHAEEREQQGRAHFSWSLQAATEERRRPLQILPVQLSVSDNFFTQRFIRKMLLRLYGCCMRDTLHFPGSIILV